MKTPKAPLWSERVAIEEAKAILNPTEEICPPPERINALLMGASRCQCGCCSLNRAVRRGFVRAGQAPVGGSEKLPNFRFGLGALGELGGLLQAGLCVLGVTVVLAGPMAAIERSSYKTGSRLTLAFASPGVRLPGATARPSDPAKQSPPLSSKIVNPPGSKLIVPEVLLSPGPTGFRVVRVGY